MGNLYFPEFGERKKVWNDENCSGCHKELLEGEKIRMVKLTHEDHDEYIALCMKCYGGAKKERVL